MDGSTTAAVDAERRLGRLRIAMMASGTVLYPWLADGSHPVVAWTLLGLGWIYTLALLLLVPQRRFPILVSATFTAFTDATFTLLWIWATGGVRSPWYVASGLAIAVAATRFPPRVAVMATGLHVGGYVAMAVALDQVAGHELDLAVRSVFAVLFATAGIVIADERVRSLRSRVRLLDLTQEVAQVGSWEWNVEDGTLTWSDELRRIFGVPKNVTPTYDTYIAAVGKEDRARVTEIIQRALSDGQPFSFEHTIVRPDGTVRWLHCRGRVFARADGRVREMVGSAQDVTERRELQGQLVTTAKLASIGTLASGIAHEINNPLAYVATNLEVMDRELAALRTRVDEHRAQTLADALAAARHGSARVRDIVRGLKSFSRAADDERAPVDVTTAADLAIAIAGHEITPRARLVRDYEPAPRVLANESRLSQVLVNLLVNAAQATGRGAPDENEIRVRIRGAGDRVRIEVSDTGCGIPDEHRARIFDPFFTTKPVGEGTGLGLSICHGLVREMGGTIAVASAAGRGSTFVVELPAADAPEAEVSGSTNSRVAPRRRRLLLVDDEVRYAASLRMLLEDTYDVTLAPDGRAAVEILRAEPEFDAVLCDLMMPALTGMDLHELVSAESPAVARRVIFLTGGPTSERARAFLSRPEVRHLQKPVELEELRAALAEVAPRSESAA